MFHIHPLLDDEVHGHFQNGDDAEYLGKGYGLTPDAMGRYTCDECGKIFKHPGSLQHHRHIHRGTHRCPSCGKVFSRRWDMERHLNKSKYGCPANRFSTGTMAMLLFHNLINTFNFQQDQNCSPY